MIKKFLIFLSFIIIFFSQNSLANDKSNIIERLKNTNNIKFKFLQSTNKINESGECTLVFPKKLHCLYDDSKQKRLIINQNKMIIIQERYDKKYLYPLKKDSFIKILDKRDLIQIINSSQINIENDKIVLINFLENEKELKILFNKETLDFNGWIINDQFNNKTSFLISVELRNTIIDEEIFKIPRIN